MKPFPLTKKNIDALKISNNFDSFPALRFKLNRTENISEKNYCAWKSGGGERKKPPDIINKKALSRLYIRNITLGTKRGVCTAAVQEKGIGNGSVGDRGNAEKSLFYYVAKRYTT